MKKTLLLLLTCSLGATLSACSTSPSAALSQTSTAEYDQATDPDDEILQTAIRDYLDQQQRPKNSRYNFMRADLNNDGLREGLVFFDLPHTYWCGWGGCTLTVFQAKDNSFKFVSQTIRIRGPVVIGRSETNGWKDLGTRLSGMSVADHNVLLRFNGAAYPSDAAGQETLPYNLAQFGTNQLFP